MRRSAIVVLVPEAEPLVGKLRLRHDRMAALGVPAHVTVLHPFRAELDTAAEQAIATIATAAEPFDATFDAVDSFPDGVVFLQPEPRQRFVALTNAFAAAFPDCPPYGGVFADPHPHLTVGSGVADDVAADLRPFLTADLPISTRVDRLTRLVEHDDHHWSVDRSWPLGQ